MLAILLLSFEVEDRGGVSRVLVWIESGGLGLDYGVAGFEVEVPFWRLRLGHFASWFGSRGPDFTGVICSRRVVSGVRGCV